MSQSGQNNPQHTEAALEPRGWLLSAGAAAVLVAVGVTLSATINPMLGRYVHWDWMVGIAPTVFILALLSLRRRWV